MIFSPSDSARWPKLASFELGGRLVAVESELVWVADAFAMVRVIAKNLTLSVGTLVVLDVEERLNGELHGTLKHAYPTARGPHPTREHARLFDDRVGANLRARGQLFRVIREWFDAQGFVEVDTPQRVPSPGLDLHLDAFASQDAFLITSPEYQMKRLLSGGLPRIYQIVHCFRDNEVGASHNPEFTMLEWYRSFASMDDVIADTQKIVSHAAQSLTGTSVVKVGSRSIDLSRGFDHLTVLEAFDRFAGMGAESVFGLLERDEDTYFRILVDQVEPQLAQMDRPVFLKEFPAQHASLARLKPTDPRVCERFELYVAGQELCNGFGELTDPVEQRARLVRDQHHRRKLGKPVYPIDEGFLVALEDGMPPSGGNALGVDRLLGLLLGIRQIGEVLPFPVGWL